ncbi:MAG: hypothetical protein KC516_03370 [Nanoarchaeota archaeon]|nr:hypothetical protein [Nanoarchaeota archaeon]
MKKYFLILIFGMFILASGVLAESLSNDKFDNFVNKVVKEKVGDKEVRDVKKVDFKELPNQVSLENIDETNLALYEVDTGENKPFYVITVSDEVFKETIKNYANKMFLDFGLSGSFEDSQFLYSAAGVQSSMEKGYVMLREGSITGISTNLEVVETSGEGEVEVIIYKNSEPVGFRNTFYLDSNGIKRDYDTVSENSILFEAGDVISVYVKVNGNANIKDVITLLEVNI